MDKWFKQRENYLARIVYAWGGPESKGKCVWNIEEAYRMFWTSEKWSRVHKCLRGLKIKNCMAWTTGYVIQGLKRRGAWVLILFYVNGGINDLV